MSRTCENIEAAPEYSHAYRVAGWPGIAVRVIGWETEPISVVGCTGCDYVGHERMGGGGYTVEPHSPDCPDDAQLIYAEEPEYERTGKLVCVMIGDDKPHTCDPSDLTRLRSRDYCQECGQIGCGCCIIPDDDEDEDPDV